MLLLIVLIVVFVIIFLLLFYWIRRKNQQDPEEEKMGIIMTALVAGIFSLLLTAVAAFFLFLILGSTNVVNALFTLDLSKRDLILMSIIYFGYLMTLDNVFQLVIKLFSSNLYLFHFLMLWTRMIAFYLIGDYFHLAHYTNMLISGGVALVLTLLEFFYDFSKRRDE